MPIKIDKKIELEILRLNSLGQGPTAISKNTNVSRKTVYNILYKNKIEIKSNRFNYNKKYNVDESFFEKIDSAEKAYFLGWIYSDGHVNFKEGYFRIALQEKDKNILILLSNIIKSTQPLKYKITNKLDSNRQNQWVLQIKRRKMVNDLKNLGLLQNKSNISFPKNINEEFLFDFIRGFFDGDGCISINIEKKYCLVSIICNLNFVEGLKSIFEKYNISYRVDKKTNTDKVVAIYINSKRSIGDFLSLIYKGKKDLSLFRKYEKYNYIFVGKEINV